MAALVGTFLVINTELRKDFSLDIKPNAETIIAFDRTTAEPLTINVLQGKTNVATIHKGSNNLWKNHQLTLTDNLGIKMGDFYFGKLNYSQLSNKNFFTSVEESKLDAELFTLNIKQKEHSERLKITVKARRFLNEKIGDYDIAKLEFEIKIDNSNTSEIQTIKNKEIKIIKVGSDYFIIAGLQADFTNKEHYFQLSIKPINLE